MRTSRGEWAEGIRLSGRLFNGEHNLRVKIPKTIFELVAGGGWAAGVLPAAAATIGGTVG